MKRMTSLLLILNLILLVLIIPGIDAAEKVNVIVLPFSVHSSENIEYVRQGVWDMLSNRLSASEKMQVYSKESVSDFINKYDGKEPGNKDLQDLGKKLNADFIVWGSITKIGKSVSLDCRLLQVSSNRTVLSLSGQTQGLDDIIPKVSEFAQTLLTQMIGPQVSTAVPVAPLVPPVVPVVTVPVPKPPIVESPFINRESQIISSMKTNQKGTLTSVVNPNFTNPSLPLDKKGTWTSQKFPYEFMGMDIGDVNGDGRMEVVAIDSHRVMIFQIADNELKTIDTYVGKSYENFLAVDIADINHNGTPEIFVTSMGNKMLNSFVLEYRDGKLVKIASGLHWFLRVIDSPSGGVILMGQQLGVNNPFDTPIFEIKYEGGQYKAAEKMKIPEGLSVYGLVMTRLSPDTGVKLVALNDLDHLCVYSQVDKPLSRLEVIGGSDDMKCMDESYGGSSNSFERVNPPPQDDSQIYAYIKPRIIVFDTNKDKTNEIIIVKNLSTTGQIFKNVKFFSSSEIYNLEWDGIGFSENWRTKKINGYVADYQFKDIDNDGQNELVLALILSTGISVSEKSAIVIYKMGPSQTAQSVKETN